MFCPNCDNLIDISKTTTKLPQSYTDDYISLITTSLLNKQPTPIMNPIIANKILKSEPFLKLDKNQQKFIQTELNNYTNSQILSNQAFYKCSNCGFNKQIPPNSHINVIPNPHTISESFTNNHLLHNIQFTNIDPFTTNYICPNIDCSSHSQKTLKPAKFTKNKNLIIHYVCPYCNSNWIN